MKQIDKTYFIDDSGFITRQYSIFEKILFYVSTSVLLVASFVLLYVLQSNGYIVCCM